MRTPLPGCARPAIPNGGQYHGEGRGDGPSFDQTDNIQSIVMRDPTLEEAYTSILRQLAAISSGTGGQTGNEPVRYPAGEVRQQPAVQDQALVGCSCRLDELRRQRHPVIGQTGPEPRTVPRCPPPSTRGEDDGPLKWPPPRPTGIPERTPRTADRTEGRRDPSRQ